MRTFLNTPQVNLAGNLFDVQKIGFKLLFVLPMDCFAMKERKPQGQQQGSLNDDFLQGLKRWFFYTMAWFSAMLPLHMVLLVLKTIYDVDNIDLQVLSVYATEAVWFGFSFVGMVYLNLRRWKLQALLDYADSNFLWRSARGQTFVDIGKSYTLARRVTMTWTLVTGGIIFYSTIEPVLHGKMELALDCWYPVDKKVPFNFMIMLLLQLWARLVMVTSFSSGSSLYVSLIIICCSQYDCLFCSLKNIFYTCGIFRTRGAHFASASGLDEPIGEYFYTEEREDNQVVHEGRTVGGGGVGGGENPTINSNTNGSDADYNKDNNEGNRNDNENSNYYYNKDNNSNNRRRISKRTQAAVAIAAETDATSRDAMGAIGTAGHGGGDEGGGSSSRVDMDDNEISYIGRIKDFRAALGSCVDHQNVIVDVCNLMEGFFHPFAFLRLAEMTLQLCFLAFTIAFSDIPASSYFTMVFFLILTLIDLYFLTFPAEYLRHQSVSVGDALMRAPWYLVMSHFRNDFLILLSFSTRPVKLTALRIFTLNADRLRVVVGTAFSYFTLLSSFNNDPDQH